MPLIWRALTLDDADGWAELTAAGGRADGSYAAREAADLRDRLNFSIDDTERDTIAVLDGERLVAAAYARPVRRTAGGRLDAGCSAEVHPDYRRRGIGAELVRRILDRSQEMAADSFPGEPVTRHLGAQQGTSGEDFLVHRGWRPVRYFHEMTRALPSEDPGADPDIVEYDARWDHALWRADEHAFAGHWGHLPRSYEDWRGPHVDSYALLTACSGLVVAGDDVVGYVLAYEYAPNDLYVGLLGVVPDARRRGLARRLLRWSLARGSEAGFGSATLHVDSKNETNAGALYESVGLRRVRTVVEFHEGPQSG